MNPFLEHEEQVERAFFEKLEKEELISDPRHLPILCRRLLEKTILMNFFAEWWGGVNYFRCLSKAPSYHELQFMEQIAREEMGHAHILAKGSLAVLGIDPFLLITKTVKEQKQLLHVFKYPEILTRSWSDVLIFNCLQDASADMQLDEFANGMFTPYCTDIKQIEAEEVGHVEHGHRAIREYLASQTQHKAELQQALDFWLPLVLEVFGKKDGKSEQLYRTYGIKHRTNEESRTIFTVQISPFLSELGLRHVLLGA